MVNRLLVLVSIIALIGCNNENIEGCGSKNINGIQFDGFKFIKINKLAFRELKDTSNTSEYIHPILHDGYFIIDTNSAKILLNGCTIIINDQLKYKITDVKIKRVRKPPTMWGTKIYHCELIQYRLNDSLILNKDYITVIKK